MECIFLGCFLFYTSSPTPSPTLKQQTSKVDDLCPCPPVTYPPGWGWQPLQPGSAGMGRESQAWRVSHGSLLCSSSLSPRRLSLAKPAVCTWTSLSLSFPHSARARGHACMVPTGVCALLQAASWNRRAVGGHHPEAPDCALASPSYLPRGKQVYSFRVCPTKWTAHGKIFLLVNNCLGWHVWAYLRPKSILPFHLSDISQDTVINIQQNNRFFNNLQSASKIPRLC